jgi:hypothetical protein
LSELTTRLSARQAPLRRKVREIAR